MVVARRGEFRIEDPWAVPAGASPVELNRSFDGAVPKLSTSCAVFWDEARLYILFTGRDDHITATYLEHDDPLYTEDVVEVFLAPESLTRYFEAEVNPRGATFDALVDSPDGNRHTMNVDVAWNCEGLFAAVRRERDPHSPSFSFETIMALPFASLGRNTPVLGETWRANFFRIDRAPGGNEFTSWRPTGKYPADFHVPAVFGSIVFQL